MAPEMPASLYVLTIFYCSRFACSRHKRNWSLIEASR